VLACPSAAFHSSKLVQKLVNRWLLYTAIKRCSLHGVFHGPCIVAVVHGGAAHGYTKGTVGLHVTAAAFHRGRALFLYMMQKNTWPSECWMDV
jgi:hypothetical protein